MKIKKLELVGFKSFKDRTVIQFDDGITGVVGPNGCGKSNIVDALVWVMGEMSAKHLRGSSMSDVIFAGAEGYAPMGMAEVSLTLENDGGPFPAQYHRFSEIQITRRLHRSGESEYLINKEPARLRDIQEIFMDTGAGAKGFSIIEQGAIGKIITAKPEDRKMLVEEAAGITKFKVRKRESQRKLESTEQNLLRLRDIIGEQQRQLDSLERQAQKAERYRKIKKEIEDKDLFVSSRIFDRARTELTLLEQALADLQERELTRETEFKEQELSLQSGRLRLAEIEISLNDKRQAQASLVQAIRVTENAVRELRFELEQARRDQEKSGSASEQLLAREQALRTELSSLVEQLQKLETDYVAARDEFLAAEKTYLETQARIETLDQELTNDRKTLLAHQQSQSHLEARRSAIEDQLVGQRERLDNEREVFQEIKSKQKEFTDRRQRIHGELEQNRQMSLEIMHQVETFEDNLKSLNLEREKKVREVEEFKDQLNQVTSRLYGLQNLRDNFEGFESGVKSIMLWQKSLAETRTDGSVEFTPLAEIIEVPTDYELALESALGQRLQVLVGGKTEQTLSAIEYLKSHRSGRSSFVTENARAQVPTVHSEIKNRPGVIALMADLARLDSSTEAGLRPLLNEIVIVDSLTVALELQKEFSGLTYVTREGDSLTPDGILTGGSSEGVESGVLQRKREIRELTFAKDEWSGKLALAQLSLKKLAAQIETLSEDLEKARKQRSDQEIKVVELKKDLERAENELRTADQALQKQSTDLAKLESQVLGHETSLNEIRGHLTELLPKIAELINQSDIKMFELTQAKAGISEASNRVMELKAKSTSFEQVLDAEKKSVSRVEGQLADVVGQLTTLRAENERTSESLSTNSVLIEQKQVELERAIRESESNESQLATLQNDFETLSAELREREATVMKLSHEVNDIKLSLHQSELRREQLHTEERVVQEQIRERYQLELANKYQEFLHLEGDEKLIAGELEDLRKRLSSVGDVNLAAIDEYNELRSRSEFMQTQFTELEEAKAQLQKVIERINRICTKRFKDTFEQINERFQKVFPVLFGGGEAMLILVDDPENQEMGIDIVARPPGKKMQSVGLLSGGEKALTAVALIFSIFLVKPSPFCLLDEVDAPLDDANVVRFNDLVREMAKRSQIIVVTHNKHTMRINNKLYGVTMEEKGVSKMVSVQLE